MGDREREWCACGCVVGCGGGWWRGWCPLLAYPPTNPRRDVVGTPQLHLEKSSRVPVERPTRLASGVLDDG